MANMEIKFEYGQNVTDKVTGYRGIITTVGYYYGKRPAQYMVEGIDTTGRPVEWWVQEDRIEVDCNE